MYCQKIRKSQIALIGLPLENSSFSSIEGSIMKLQVLLYHTHTHQTMLTPTLTTLFSNLFLVQAHLIPVYITIESPFPAPEHTIALFHLSVSILYHLGIYVHVVSSRI